MSKLGLQINVQVEDAVYAVSGVREYDEAVQRAMWIVSLHEKEVDEAVKRLQLSRNNLFYLMRRIHDVEVGNAEEQ